MPPCDTIQACRFVHQHPLLCYKSRRPIMSSKVFCSLALIALALPAAAADSITGTYLESRTCQVYTGPCFANAETALAGREAVMAWNIEAGKQNNVDLTGLSVVMVVRGNDTLGYQGVDFLSNLTSAVVIYAISLC